ncbi:MAG: hypothetical protein CL878_08960 [Dehalococcoidia bacterium]|nr:hypothetical protein [Dehalococcoidia bacterium]
MSPASVELGLERQVVLLAGVESGAGEAVVKAFAGSGAWVVVHSCQDLDGTKRIVDGVRSAGGRAMPAIAVPNDAASAWALVERIVAEWVQLDVLVCDLAGLATNSIWASRADPFPPPEVHFLTTEAVTRMRADGGGRIILLLPAAADSRPVAEQAAEWVKDLSKAVINDHVLVNAVHRTESVAPADLAHVLLFLGSAWNTALTGSCLSLDNPLA